MISAILPRGGKRTKYGIMENGEIRRHVFQEQLLLVDFRKLVEPAEMVLNRKQSDYTLTATQEITS